MLHQFREIELDRNGMDELLALRAFGRAFEMEWTDYDLEVPPWVTDRLALLDKEIRSRVADALAKDIKDTELRLEALKSRDERKEELNARLARLKAKAAPKGGA